MNLWASTDIRFTISPTVEVFLAEFVITSAYMQVKNKKQLKQHEDRLSHLHFLHRIQLLYRTASLKLQAIIFLLQILFTLYTLQNASWTVWINQLGLS